MFGEATALMVLLMLCAYTIACFVIYHKIFRVYYLGSVTRGIMGELVTCVIISTVLVGFTIYLWYIAVIILIIVTFILRKKYSGQAVQTAVTAGMVILIIFVAFAGIAVKKSKEDEKVAVIEEEEDYYVDDVNIETEEDINSGNVTVDGVFNTEEDDKEYISQIQEQAVSEQDYVTNHVIVIEENSPITFFDRPEEGVLKEEVLEQYGECDEKEEVVSETEWEYYDQVWFKGIQGGYGIMYDVSESKTVKLVKWSAESYEKEKCIAIVEDLIDYYEGKYGEYEKFYAAEQIPTYQWSLERELIQVDIALDQDIAYISSSVCSLLYMGDNQRSQEEYILPNSDFEYLTREDLEGMNDETCRYARNEIYARHGRLFQDQQMQDYFNSCSWYSGQIAPEDFQESVLSDIERYNRDLIIEYEQEMGYRD